MNSNRFIRLSLCLTLVLLILVASVQIVIDPLFQYHKPWFDMEPTFSTERYQVAGIAKSFEYDNVIMGNSMSENFWIYDVNDTFGGDSVKLTMNASLPLEWSYLLNILKDKNPKYVMINISPCDFSGSSIKFSHDLPIYLYDTNYLNDVQYLLNFSIINKFSREIILRNLKDDVIDMDKAFMWDNKPESEKKNVLLNYERYPTTNEDVDIESYCVSIDNNISLLSEYFDLMPDTQFMLFFPPYSMLYWDQEKRQNTISMQKSGYLRMCEELTEYDNVCLYFWNDQEMLSIMENLENYKDAKHYYSPINRNILQRIKEKKGLLTKDNYQAQIDKFFSYVEEYDYDSLFE